MPSGEPSVDRTSLPARVPAGADAGVRGSGGLPDRARVVVVPLMPISFLGPGDAGRQQAGGAQPPPLPAKYADPNQSGLTYDVTAGDQKHDLPLD